MFLPSFSSAWDGWEKDLSTYSVYVGPEGLHGSVRFIADCEDGIPVRIAVLADGMGMAGWLVQNLYSR